mmetsp:Transcript_29666/g.43974  ORF Transcript_29666/g.43974 Transcript_29666/m.43974 type:complete len:322 (-) Transcript_29666:369-1334(-)
MEARLAIVRAQRTLPFEICVNVLHLVFGCPTDNVHRPWLCRLPQVRVPVRSHQAVHQRMKVTREVLEPLTERAPRLREKDLAPRTDELILVRAQPGHVHFVVAALHGDEVLTLQRNSVDVRVEVGRVPQILCDRLLAPPIVKLGHTEVVLEDERRLVVVVGPPRLQPLANKAPVLDANVNALLSVGPLPVLDVVNDQAAGVELRLHLLCVAAGRVVDEEVDVHGVPIVVRGFQRVHEALQRLQAVHSQYFDVEKLRCRVGVAVCTPVDAARSHQCGLGLLRFALVDPRQGSGICLGGALIAQNEAIVHLRNGAARRLLRAN